MADTSSSDVVTRPQEFNAEPTRAGQQSLIPGVDPITARDRLDLAMDRPLGRGKAARSDTEIGGLFDPMDPARVDLFDMVPIGRELDADGNEVALVRSKADLAAELDAEDAFVAEIQGCLAGMG